MYKRFSQGWVKHLDFMVWDIICLQISFCLAYILRHGWNNPYESVLYRNTAIILFLIDIVVVVFFEPLKNVLKRGYSKEFSATLKHDCLVILLGSFHLFLTQESGGYSRLTLVMTGLIYLAISYGVRLLWKKHLLRRGVEGSQRSLLIITGSEMLDTVVDNILKGNYQVFHIAGIALLDQNRVGEKVGGIPIVADSSSVVDYVCRQWVDEVFFNLPGAMPYPEELIDSFSEAGVVVHIKLVKSGALYGKRQFVERLGGYTVMTVTLNSATVRQTFCKRAMDILGGAVGCVITGLLFLVVAPMIYIQSPGPVFFTQERVGRNGKKFKMYKFRSMYLDAEERKKELMAQNRVKDGMMFKMEDDPRIIGGKKGIGSFIRKSSIDEFPQFWNVLKGDMSLVGTRPPTVDEWDKYDLHHRIRLAVRPGITGMWQVSGRSEITDFEEVVRLDKEYIQNWSLALDIKILFKTVLVVFGKDGSM